MLIQFSPVITPRTPGNGGPPQGQGGGIPVPAHVRESSNADSTHILDLHERGEWASPVAFLFDSRMRGQGFAPHARGLLRDLLRIRGLADRRAHP